MTLPIHSVWKELFQELKKDGRQATVQGGAWAIHDASVHDVQDTIVVLDIPSRYTYYGDKAQLAAPQRCLIALDAIAGVSFEHNADLDDGEVPEIPNDNAP